jgi:hypothetical protein
MNQEPLGAFVLGIVAIACMAIVAMDVARKCGRGIKTMWGSRRGGGQPTKS